LKIKNRKHLSNPCPKKEQGFLFKKGKISINFTLNKADYNFEIGAFLGLYEVKRQNTT